ncbi:MAG: type III-B CRISPR module RAMP protein Cmr1 [Blastocatellia bacterium]
MDLEWQQSELGTDNWCRLRRFFMARLISNEVGEKLEALRSKESLLVESETERHPRVLQIRKYKLLTPLFGGGVRANENDTTKLIRETSIRGQLRFWWRAMRGTGRIVEMKKREDEIFGSGGQKAVQSKILISVKVLSSGSQVSAFQNDQKTQSGPRRPKTETAREVHEYAAFPLSPDKDERNDPNWKSALVSTDVEFHLKICYPKELEAEIQAALWAWETFGGVGARTRRGFGAIALTQIDGKPINAPKFAEIEQYIRQKLSEYLLCDKQVDSNLPHLNAEIDFRIKKFKDPKDAWKSSIDKLRQFRQVRREGRDRNRPLKKGRSFWPEPDEIRRLTGKNAEGRHRPLSSVGKFPRADFGLPIIFHFIDQEEPGDCTLKPAKYSRLASPLILRPIECADGAAALALLLVAPRASELDLELSHSNGNAKVVAKLTVEEAKLLTAAGLGPLGNQTDVLKAFLDYFAN